jgi:hypothetical protein
MVNDQMVNNLFFDILDLPQNAENSHFLSEKLVYPKLL